VLFNVSINNDSAIIPCKSWVYEGVEISAVTEVRLCKNLPLNMEGVEISAVTEVRLCKNLPLNMKAKKKLSEKKLSI